MIHIHIPGEPVAQGRPRFVRRHGFVRAVDPPKSRNWKATAQEHMGLAMNGREPLQGAVECSVQATFTCPKTDHRKRQPRGRRWHSKRPDAENVAKAVLDAATGVLWLDDAQVARLTVEKLIGRQGEAPGLVLEVRELAELEVRR